MASAAPPSRIACVTGASSGIGRASALALAAAGWTVVVSGRRQQELDETVRLAQERTKDAPLLAVAGDLSKPEDVDALFDTIRDRFGASSSLLSPNLVFSELTPMSRIQADSTSSSTTPAEAFLPSRSRTFRSPTSSRSSTSTSSRCARSHFSFPSIQRR